MASTFKKMKREIATGWDEVLWSESYGFGDAAALIACVAFGCAAQYLGSKLDSLVTKVGQDFLEQTFRNKGKVLTGPGNLEVQAGDAYWSVYHKIFGEKITTERYVRLYVRYRRQGSGSTSGNPIDSALLHPNGKAYFFRDDQYQRYDFAQDKVDKVGRIGIDGWSGVWNNGTDAAVMHPNGYAYFFRDGQYQRYDFAQDKVDKEAYIGEDGWFGVWNNGLDAAVLHPRNGYAYFFRDGQYQRYDFAQDKVDKVGHIGIDGWPGLWNSGIDAAVTHVNGKIYFFRGNEYQRHDIDKGGVDKTARINIDGWSGVWSS